MNRTKYAIKNILFGFGGKIINLFLGFVSRTVFIYFLGNYYLGINGLYAQILSLLSFAEMGFGVAMNYVLYEPVANGDEEKVIKLLSYYKKTYRTIAFVVLIMGISFLPFLQNIVKDSSNISLFELRLYYVFFLFDSVISYFVSYKFSYINACQKNYVQSQIETILFIVTTCFQILVIIKTHNYLAYLITHSLILVLSRLYISFYLNKKFPLLRKKTKSQLTKDEKKPIFYEIKGLIIHQFAGVVVHSTDNIIISALSGAGVFIIGLISNYNLLINSVLAFVVIIFNNLTSGFGNLVASKTNENYRKVFLTANFMNFWVYGFCSIAFFVLIPPFISLWIGNESLIDIKIFALIVLNSYLQGQSVVYNSARLAKGNFNLDKWVSLIQVLLNLVISIVGAKYYGVIGVYIGTIISRLFYCIVKPAITYKYLFEHSSLEYFSRGGLYLLCTISGGLITYFVTNELFDLYNLVGFALSLPFVVVIPNMIFLIIFRKTPEFDDMKKRFYMLIHKR